jgi:hypothetical protein
MTSGSDNYRGLGGLGPPRA